MSTVRAATTTTNINSRIPKFGTSRIPLPGAPLPTRILPLAAGRQQQECAAVEVTKGDLGKRVRSHNSGEGVLRYVGEVQFAAGVWCGIELDGSTGKHDGSVRGVRYFACPNGNGLMTPLSKVSLADVDCSGPYSMIFGIEHNDNQLQQGDTTQILSVDDDDASLTPPEKQDVTFVKEGEPQEDDGSNTTFNIHATFDIDTGSHLDDDNTTLSKTVVNCESADATFVQTKTENDNNKTFDLNVTNAIYARRSLGLDFQDLKSTSTPGGEVARRFHLSPSHGDEDSNKRDSLEVEESLGILTPDQMTDKSELIRFLQLEESSVRNFSLGLIDLSSVRDDCSLGLIDLSNVTMLTSSIGGCRYDQTPSPEELPLDPMPIRQDSKDKKQPPSSFITSITSITSLDTGYQGDGEMSRPASRGADNSPLTRRPQPRQPPRRADPMTDSDFYTESDADMHDEHPLRGDRKAQVIDGTLYGVDAQATADLYANNRENMDSSGIFTDIERTEDLSSADNDLNEQHNVELTPTDSSTQTITDDSQTHLMLLDKTQPTPAKRILSPQEADVVSNASTTITKSPSIRSFRSDQDNKHKMPKRNVASKVKAMIEPSNKENNEKRSPPKKAGPGRWDAVMNKISAPDPRKPFKGVKSKVFTSLNTNAPRTIEKKTESPSQKPSPNNRRVRSRVIHTLPKNNGSISSSLSDLSGAPRTKAPGSAKKQREVLKANQVLTGTQKVSPKTGPNEARNNSKNLAISNKEVKEKKKEIIKDNGRATVKGGRVSPGTRPPLPQRAAPKLLQPAPRTAEALAVLVHHLVYNLEAFKNPGLRKEAEKAKLEAEEARMSCGLLEESLSEEKQRHSNIVQDERNKFRAEIAQLIEKHRSEVIQINSKQQETRILFENQRDAMKDNLIRHHEDQMRKIKVEFQKLQKTHDESLDILRQENDAIREEIDERNDKLKREYEAKEVKLQEAYEDISRIKESSYVSPAARSNGGDTSWQEVQSLQAVLELKQCEIAELRKALAEANQRVDYLKVAEEKVPILTAKCEDLQQQLERKNENEKCLYSENKKLNDLLMEEVNQNKRCHQHIEELQWRLQHNKEVFKVLESNDQTAFTRSMITSSFNERHSTPKHTAFERALSFRERKLSTKSNASRMSRSSLEADLDDISPPSSPKVKSVVEKQDSVSYVLEMDESPEVVASRIVRRSFRNGTPPKNTPTKSPAGQHQRSSRTYGLMQSSSASSIATTATTAREDVRTSRSTSTGRGDEQDHFDWGATAAACSSPISGHRFDESPYSNGDYDALFKLPQLPSEIGRAHDANTLPVPKHLAGEPVISESNSEDESSSSSSVQL